MKRTIFSLMTILIVAFVCINLMSCGPDDDPTPVPNNKMETILQSKKWYWTDSEVKSYSYGGSVDTQTETLYFMSGNQGYGYSTTRSKDSDLGLIFNDIWYNFTYSVSGNQVTVKTGTETNIYTYNESTGFLMRGSFFFTPQDISTNDVIWNHVKEQNYLNILNNINSYITVSHTYKDCIYNIQITSSLSSVLSSEYILYGVEGDEGGDNMIDYDIYLEDTGNNTYNFIMASEEGKFYVSAVKEVDAKEAAGEKITDSEKDLRTELKKVIEKIEKEFQCHLYIKLGNKKYYFMDIDYKGKHPYSYTDILYASGH